MWLVRDIYRRMSKRTDPKLLLGMIRGSEGAMVVY